jgi:ankyrin repeat protein
MRTPLQFAARKGYGDCLKVLIRARVNLNAKNSVTGRTALHEAVEGNPFRGGQEDMIKLLLRAGANTEIKDKKGRTPKQMAVAIKRPDLAKLFSARRP